jgi:SAM-dependent methyltransferase
MKRSPPTQSPYTLTELLAALAEMIRLRLLRLLEAEELSVGEVAKVVQLPQSTVSRHLKVLSDAGWLARRAAGPAMLYRLVLDDLSIPARSLWLTARAELTQHPSAELDEDLRRLGAVLAERRLDSQTFFGRIAGEEGGWDLVRARLFGSDFTCQALLGLLPPDWVVADLGCGTGNASELLAGHVREVIAVDFSEPMLAAARQRLAGAANVRFLSGGLENLPLSDSSVDATVCMLVLHHVREPGLALREMRRILRSGRGGLALVVEMLAHDREEYRQMMGHVHLGFAPAQVEDMMRQAGFAAARSWILPGDPAAKGPGLFAAVGRGQ